MPGTIQVPGVGPGDAISGSDPLCALFAAVVGGMLCKSDNPYIIVIVM